MLGAFQEHPLWHNYQGRSFWVVSLSDPEHRLRDARALIDLREFLPPARSGQCSFATVTLNPGGAASKWPTIPDGDGVVILGRPGLFGEGVRQLLNRACPPLLFQFKSEQPGDLTGYRTIVRRGDDDGQQCQSFEMQRTRGNGRGRLCDNGIVYSGWSGNNPVVLLAGTSTVGTWGAVRYATMEPSDRDDLRWFVEVQGVVKATVVDGPDAFDSVEVAPLDVVAPARVWMSGGDLPPHREWKNWKRLRLSKSGAKSGFDLRILINGQEVMQKATTHIPALVLLAWLGHKNSISFPGGIVATVTPRDVGKALYHFLRDVDGASLPNYPYMNNETAFFDQFKNNIRGALVGLTAAIGAAGGIAFTERGNGDSDIRRHTICAGNLPHFLPSVG